MKMVHILLFCEVSFVIDHNQVVSITSSLPSPPTHCLVFLDSHMPTSLHFLSIRKNISYECFYQKVHGHVTAYNQFILVIDSSTNQFEYVSYDRVVPTLMENCWQLVFSGELSWNAKIYLLEDFKILSFDTSLPIYTF